MKHPLILLAISLIICGLTPTHAQAQSTAQLEIRLIEATNQSSQTDPKLAPYANHLKRLFRFDSYQQIQQTTATVKIPGKTNIRLKNGTTLQIQTSGNPKAPQAKLNWMRGDASLLRTQQILKKGTPALLGGPKSPKGNYILLILPK